MGEPMRIGELFAGYGGLGMGVRSVIGGDIVWFSEIDPAPSKILAHHFPGVANLGDITKIDWSTVESVDVLTGGFPCQDVSLAGARAGLSEGTRSGLWSEFARAISVLRPSLVVIENVRGLLSARAGDVEEWTDEEVSDLESGPVSVGDAARDDRPVLRALGAVLGDLADLGYDAEWCGVRAADAGAPHGRFRVFIVAWPSVRHSGHGAGASRDGIATTNTARVEGGVRDGDNVRPRSGTGQHRPAARGSVVRVGSPRVGRSGLENNSGRRGLRATSNVGAPTGNVNPSGNEDSLHRAGTSGNGESAENTDLTTSGERRLTAPRQAKSGRARADSGRRGGTPTPDPSSERLRQHTGEPSAEETGQASRDLTNGARGRWPHPNGRSTPPDTDNPGCGEHGGGFPVRTEQSPAEHAGTGIEWGPYEPAIRRWETAIGRTAPPPTNPDGKNGSHRLSSEFVEWMMGLPAGHVTNPEIGLTRNQQLKALGNGVVPAQASLAVRALLQRIGAAA